MWESFQVWFISLGEQYGVNPVLFGSLYVGAIPFFTVSLAWLIRNLRTKKSIVLPALSTGIWFSSAYLYLIIAGRNVPIWVYLLVVAMIGLGAYSTVKKIKTRMTQEGS